MREEKKALSEEQIADIAFYGAGNPDVDYITATRIAREIHAALPPVTVPTVPSSGEFTKDEFHCWLSEQNRGNDWFIDDDTVEEIANIVHSSFKLMTERIGTASVTVPTVDDLYDFLGTLKDPVGVNLDLALKSERLDVCKALHRYLMDRSNML